jgi:prolyl oligopeptidase
MFVRNSLFLYLIIFIFGCSTKTPTLDMLFRNDKFLWLEEQNSEGAKNWVNKSNAVIEKAIMSTKKFKDNYNNILGLLAEKVDIPDILVHGEYAYTLYKIRPSTRGQWRRIKIQKLSIPVKLWELVIDFDDLSMKESKNINFNEAKCLKPEETLCLIAFTEDGNDEIEIREFDTVKKVFVQNGFKFRKNRSTFSWIDKDKIALSTKFETDDTTQSGFGTKLKILSRNSRKYKKTLLDVPKNYFTITPYSRNYKDKSITFAARYHSELQFDTSLINGDNIYPINIPDGSPVHGIIGEFIVVTLIKDWNLGEQKFVTNSVLAIPILDILARKDSKDYSIKKVFSPPQGDFLNGKVSITRNFIVIDLVSNVKGRVTVVKFNNGDFKVDSKFKFTENHIETVDFSYNRNIIYYSSEGFISPKSIRMLNLQSGEDKILYHGKNSFNNKGMVVEQFFAYSKDSTRIPYFIIGKKEIIDSGNAPTFLKGYGGYGISLLPSYDSIYGKLWLEKGGVFVIANVRGGGEYGPDWYRAGTKENKYHSIEDFIAVAKALVDKKVTTSSKLGIYGGSLGGLIVGGAMTSEPKLFKAAVAVVPDFDMIRGHEISGGSWMGEVGDPKNERDRAAILKYSPYHRLKTNIKYPNLFAYSTRNDNRVHPAHARKFVAKLRSYGNSALYYEATSGGHKGSNTIEQKAVWKSLMMTFFETELFL